MKAKKKENIVIIVVLVLVLMLVAIIGVSYAAFSYSGLGSKVNTITTGSITMTYEESDNTISLNGALPTTDKTGKVRLTNGEYFDFTVSSEITGNVNINYEISAKDVTDSSAKKIDGKYIKLYLTRLTDNGEEELMAPEVYNEETSANDYTGRPAKEMSLYKSSMNSSESNNYRLRMYVDESYNPQGDGGGLTFSVKINVYGKDGDKYVPLTTQKILEDNELKEEVLNMFDYTSNGFAISSTEEANPDYITSGLYSMEDEDGISYYFRGNVNNNVQFGEYKNDYYVYRGVEEEGFYQTDESCKEAGNSTCNQVKLASKGDKMYWKIVRINGDGSLRLIYNGTSVSHPEYDYDAGNIKDSAAVGYTPYNLERDDPKYTGYTYDNGTDSFIKKEVDTWYRNALSNTEYDSKVGSGRFCSDSSNYRYDEKYGDYVFASYDRLAKNYIALALDGGEGHNIPTLKCPETAESYGGSYRLKAGLITGDELSLAGEIMGYYSDSYLNVYTDGTMLQFWSMTPAAFTHDRAYVWFEIDYLSLDYVSNSSAARPVINVTTDNGFTSGDGTALSPYVISE